MDLPEKHRFSNPVPSFFNAEDMRACVEHGDGKCTIVIPSGKICQHYKGANCFPISWSSNDLGLRTVIVVLGQLKQQSLDIWLLFRVRDTERQVCCGLACSSLPEDD